MKTIKLRRVINLGGKIHNWVPYPLNDMYMCTNCPSCIYGIDVYSNRTTGYGSE